MAPRERSQNTEGKRVIERYNTVVEPWFEEVGQKGSFNSR